MFSIPTYKRTDPINEWSSFIKHIPGKVSAPAFGEYSRIVNAWQNLDYVTLQKITIAICDDVRT